MSTLEIGLAVALGLALILSLALAAVAHTERRKAWDAAFALGQAKARNAGEEQARAAIAAEVGTVLKPFRTLLEQQSAAITRASGNLGAAVTANGQRFDNLDTLMADLQLVTRTLKSVAETIALVRDESPATRVAAQRHPSVAPPGSAEALAPEPAQVAAGLGPRPTSRPLPASATPHPPPVRVGPASIRPPPIASPPPRPARVAAPTLPSMQAVTTSGESEGRS